MKTLSCAWYIQIGCLLCYSISLSLCLIRLSICLFQICMNPQLGTHILSDNMNKSSSKLSCMYYAVHVTRQKCTSQTNVRDIMINQIIRLYALDRVSSSFQFCCLRPSVPRPPHAFCNIMLGVCMNNKIFKKLFTTVCYMTDNFLSVTWLIIYCLLHG